jgi:hypothetical protein
MNRDISKSINFTGTYLKVGRVPLSHIAAVW